MEVKPRYKQTEIGLIPESWEVARIGELFSFKNGLNKSKEHFGHGTPIVNYTDVFNKSSLSNKDISGRVLVTPKEILSYNIKKGDVFFTRTSEIPDEIGMTSVMLEDADNTVYSGFVLRARPLNDKLTNNFKAYCFSANYFRKQIISRASYTTRALTSGRSLSTATVVIPPKVEQESIASALNDIDSFTKSLNNLIAKKRAIKQATMQQIFSENPKKSETLGQWKPRKIEELGMTYGGIFGKSKADFNTGKSKYIPFTNVINNTKIDIKDLESVNITPEERQNKVKKGDLLLNGSSETADETAMCSFMPEEVNDLYLNSFCFGFRIKDKEAVDGLFIAYYMRSPTGRNLIKFLAQGSTRHNLSKKSLLETALRLPKKEIQIAISSILSEMDSEITSLEKFYIKASFLKEAMMQELLTGRTRLI